jgi:hypothetical protein
LTADFCVLLLTDRLDPPPGRALGPRGGCDKTPLVAADIWASPAAISQRMFELLDCIPSKNDQMADQPIRFDDGAAYERMMGAWSRPTPSKAACRSAEAHVLALILERSLQEID